MSTKFTEELRKSLSDFVRNTSDEEFYQGLMQADYEFFRHIGIPLLKHNPNNNQKIWQQIQT